MSGVTNDDRADWAEIALRAFAQHTGQNFDDIDDLHDIVADFLTDLGHFCDRYGIDLMERWETGRNHYEYETSPDYEGD